LKKRVKDGIIKIVAEMVYGVDRAEEGERE